LDKKTTLRGHAGIVAEQEANPFCPRGEGNTVPLADKVTALGEGAPSASLARRVNQDLDELRPLFRSPPRQPEEEKQRSHALEERSRKETLGTLDLDLGSIRP
jgi:hypothetical protein